MAEMAGAAPARHPNYALALAGGFSLAAAWLMPGTVASAAFGWACALIFILAALNEKRPYLTSYIIGVVSHLLSFHWLLGTIKNFGGFDFFASSGIFLLFISISALQFPIFILLYRASAQLLPWKSLLLAGAWVSSEMIAIRIFPWHLGHTQLPITPLSSLAALGGAPLVSFAMILLTALLYRKNLRVLIGMIVLISAFNLTKITPPSNSEKSVAIIQANISLEEKHNMKFIASNRERYRELTVAAIAQSSADLVVWPETVIQDWIPDSVGLRLNHPALAPLPASTPLLIGALTYNSKKELFNSAIAILADDRVPPPYHKRILMPFGEYTPFGDVFPFLAEINSTAGGFTAGSGPGLFDFQNGIIASPLICYEDIVPRLSIEAANAGANLLVNLTNDAWFGDSVAPRQHHLIASFRAIETNRYLVRSTNTGLTAVVNPEGQTVSALPGYSEGVLRAEIEPRSGSTIYMQTGDLPWWILSILFLLFLIAASLLRILRSRNR